MPFAVLYWAAPGKTLHIARVLYETAEHALVNAENRSRTMGQFAQVCEVPDPRGPNDNTPEPAKPSLALVK